MNRPTDPRGLTWEDLYAMKQKSRDDDARRLAAGEVTVDELIEENRGVPKAALEATIDFAAIPSVGETSE